MLQGVGLVDAVGDGVKNLKVGTPAAIMTFVSYAEFFHVILGEIANFAAYAFAPAILVTPLGALNIIVSAVLPRYLLDERMHIFCVVGCVLYLFGSTTIVLHAPHETPVSSVRQVCHFATEPGFLVYACIVLVIVGVLIYRYVPRYGQTHLIVYVGICSLMGSLMVMCVKVVAIAIKLRFQEAITSYTFKHGFSP